MALAYSGRGGTPTKNSKSITVNGVAANSLNVAVVEAFKFSFTDSDVITGMGTAGGAAWALAKRQRFINPVTFHVSEVSVWYREGAVAGNTTGEFTDAGADEYYWNWREFTGAATSGALDKTAGDDIAVNATGSIVSGSTGALALADSLVVGGVIIPQVTAIGGPGVGSDFAAAIDGGAPPNVIGARSTYHLPNATTAINWTQAFTGTAFQGGAIAIATFKGATTQKRIEITGIDTSVNGTTGWTIYYWQTDGVSQTMWRVPGITAEASGGKIFVTSAQAAAAGATFPNLSDGTNINCMAYRPGTTPVRGLTGVLVGTIRDYT